MSNKTKTAVEKIRTVSSRRFASAVKKSTSASMVLKSLGIYTNGRNIDAVYQRIFDNDLELATK